jgi:hypothetical protein
MRTFWLRGLADLGNRLRAYSAAVIYATVTKRTLIVDWRDRVYSKGVHNVFFDVLKPHNVDCTSEDDEFALGSFHSAIALYLGGEGRILQTGPLGELGGRHPAVFKLGEEDMALFL